jgi:hypothetical protein
MSQGAGIGSEQIYSSRKAERAIVSVEKIFGAVRRNGDGVGLQTDSKMSFTDFLREA